MAEKRTARQLTGRLRLAGRADDANLPDLAVRVVDAAGEVIDSAALDPGGEIKLRAASLERGAHVLVGPADLEPGDAPPGTLRSYRAEAFASLLEAGDVVIGEAWWRRWWQFTRCVSGSVRRCVPKPWVVELLESSVSRRSGISVDLPPIRDVIGWWPRCSPVCNGIVEVYRRRCCCEPLVPFDPRIPEIVDVLDPPIPDPIPEPDPPFPPLPPGPGPDPVPWEGLARVTSRGALDVAKVNRIADRQALRKLDAREQVEYLNARPYLWCHCSTAVKVGEGTLQGDGSFDVCWTEPLLILPPGCRLEVAYRVRQPRFGALVTIYDGVAANQWFAMDDQPTLTSYSPWAVGCKEPVVPGSGPFVVLQDIGDTESHRLATPAQDGVFSVGSPAYNSGLLDPVVIPAAALGQNRNRNLGGLVRLRYEFTDGMHGIGAVYFRVSFAACDAAGDPVEPFQPLPAPVWKFWDLGTGDDGTHSLGPVTVGGESGLYVIPFDGVAPLDTGDEWHDGQYHALVDTASRPEGRYLIAVEVFDGSGDRLRPTGSTGTGTEAGFTFRRWQSPGTTTDVPYAALTHMLWWDNRKAVAKIEDIRENGSASSAQCQFLTGASLDTVSIGYRAYHPKPDSTQPGFILRHDLTLRRGLGGPTWDIEQDTGVNVGGPGGVTPHESLTKTFADLLDPPTLTKCAFSAVLTVTTKTTNGEGHSLVFDASDQAAFAAEVTP